MAPAVRRRRQDEEEQPLSAFEAQCAPDKYTRPTPDIILRDYPDGYEPKHLAMKPCLMNQEMEDVGQGDMKFLMSFTCRDENPFPEGIPDIEEGAHCDPICDEQVLDPTARCCDADETPKSLDETSDCYDWRFQGKINANGECEHTEPGSSAQTDPETMFGDEPSIEKPPVFDGALTKQMMADSAAAVEALTERMNARFDELDKGFDANVDNLVASAEKDLEWLSEPFKPMDLQMNPGAGIGADGQLLQPSEFEIQLAGAKDFQDANINNDIVDAKGSLPPTSAESLGEKMTGDCLEKYRDKVTKNDFTQSAIEIYDEQNIERQTEVSYACPDFDTLRNTCGEVIDAAQYIGVTFDVTKGYNLDGYRNALVLLWCSEEKKWKGQNIPDFMHVEGVYETKMGTESFESIEERASIISKRSNTRTGTSSFRDESRKLSAAESESTSESGGGQASTPVFSVSGKI